MEVVVLDKENWKLLGGGGLKIEKIEIDDRGIIKIKTKSADVSIVFNEKGDYEKFKQVKNVISEL